MGTVIVGKEVGRCGGEADIERLSAVQGDVGEESEERRSTENIGQGSIVDLPLLLLNHVIVNFCPEMEI